MSTSLGRFISLHLTGSEIVGVSLVLDSIVYSELHRSVPRAVDHSLTAMVSKRVSCSLGVWGWSLLLLLLVQLAATQNATCPHQCSPLSQCLELIPLLLTPTADNLYALRQATCSKGEDPLVCCPTVPPPPSLLPKDCGQGTQLEFIFGGTEVPIYSHPWMAVLGFSETQGSSTEFLCGGSVINERYVLTAAQCVQPQVLRNRRLEVIRLGEWDLSTEVDCEDSLQGFRICAPPTQDFTYEEIIIHPDYNNRSRHSDDIALIRLNRSIDLSGQWVQPVCLPPQGIDVRRRAGQREPLVAGWGFTENSTSSKRLLHVALPFVDDEKCSSIYKTLLVQGQVCLGGRAGRDSCNGDSGGPVVLSGPKGPPFLQIGIVSYGSTQCGQKDIPAVYTSVSHYRDWIERTLRP